MQKHDILDVEQLVEESFKAFCEQHDVTSRTDKQKVLAQFVDAAKALRGKQ
jgi:hypothetical protein